MSSNDVSVSSNADENSEVISSMPNIENGFFDIEVCTYIAIYVLPENLSKSDCC